MRKQAVAANTRSRNNRNDAKKATYDALVEMSMGEYFATSFSTWLYGDKEMPESEPMPFDNTVPHVLEGKSIDEAVQSLLKDHKAVVEKSFQEVGG